MDRRDPRGYYQTLNIEPGGPVEEVELAYRLLKARYLKHRESQGIRKIQEAYETLRDPERRQAYDAIGRPRRAAGGKARMGKPRMLGLLLAVLFTVVAIVYGPTLKANLTSYDPGDILYLRTNKLYFGTIMRYEKEHLFYNGASAPAYLIEDASGGSLWYPARDLTRICRK